MISKFNLHIIRRLFNPRQSGGRIPFKITLTSVAQTALRETVPTGKGKYASATIDLALRFLLALVGKLDLEQTSEAIARAIVDQDQLVKNLRSVAEYIENYTEPEEPKST
jgi:hypothetical protein